MIETKVDIAADLSIHSCHGQMRMEEISSRVSKPGNGEATNHTIWNFSDADLSGITGDDVLALSSSAKLMKHTGRLNKTAVVVPDELSWGLGRMYQIVSGTNENACTVELFRNLIDAQRWIDRENQMGTE